MATDDNFYKYKVDYRDANNRAASFTTDLMGYAIYNVQNNSGYTYDYSTKSVTRTWENNNSSLE